jgi:hypothetical protein
MIAWSTSHGNRSLGHSRDGFYMGCCSRTASLVSTASTVSHCEDLAVDCEGLGVGIECERRRRLGAGFSSSLVWASRPRKSPWVSSSALSSTLSWRAGKTTVCSSSIASFKASTSPFIGSNIASCLASVAIWFNRANQSNELMPLWSVSKPRVARLCDSRIPSSILTTGVRAPGAVLASGLTLNIAVRYEMRT